jgi:hypothetical protein
VIEMGNISDKTAKKLERHGILTVLDMKMPTTAESSVILGDKYARVSNVQLKEWHKAAEQENKSSVLSRARNDLDHHKDENHYLPRYGRDEWLTVIHQCCVLSGYGYVTEMIEHIVEETKRVMKGTKHDGKDTYHYGALPLMTCMKSI